MKRNNGVSLITLIITIIVVIILAVIVLNSGASDAPDQAAFSKFTSQMGELQDAVTKAMLEAKGAEILNENSRTEAQLYNFVARGGYAGFEWEKDQNEDGVLENDIPKDAKWLTMADAEAMKATLIYKNKAKESIGQELPVIKVENGCGVNQELSYFVTPKGTVFCWPPYVYDGKCYVNANASARVTDEYGKEIKSAEEIIKDWNYKIKLETEEILVEHVEANSSVQGPFNLSKELKSYYNDTPPEVFVFYEYLFGENQYNPKISGVATGHSLHQYNNKEK